MHVHVMVGASQATLATSKLADIYGETSLNNKAMQYPLGQQLLLGLLAAMLNATNLGQLDFLLLKRQALFCCKLVTLATQDISHINGEFKVMIDNQKTLGPSRKY